MFYIVLWNLLFGLYFFHILFDNYKLSAKKNAKITATSIPMWSPTIVLTCPADPVLSTLYSCSL